MPPDVVKGRSKGLRANKLDKPDWKMVRNEVSVVRGDVDPAALKAVAVYAQELYVMLRSFLGGPDPGDHLISVKVFKDQIPYKRFASLAGAPNAQAYYDPRNAEIVHWLGEYATQLLFQRAFSHEFTHAYVDRVFRKLEPIWFMEGIAEWFSNLEWRGDIFVPGQMSRFALQLLSMESMPLSIKTLTTIPRDEIYGYRFQQYFAQAWSLVDYLMTQLPYRAVEKMLLGEQIDLESHEEAWRAHVRMMIGY